MESRPYGGQAPKNQLPPSASQPIHSLPLLPQAPIKKRRTSASGSRGVANLTPEQLAKKRANDREAQRAIRERTKGQIESLERKIQELTAQKPYQELQHAIRQKEIVEAENEEIKRRLISIQSLIQPLLNPACADGPTSLLNNDSPGLPTSYTTAEHRLSTVAAPTYSDVASVRSSASTTSTYTSPQAPRPTPPTAQGNFPSQPAQFSPVNTFGQRPSNAQHSAHNRPQDDKLALDYLIQNRHSNGDGLQNARRERAISATSHAVIPMDTLSPPSNINGGSILAPYAVPIRNIAPTCPLDCLLLDFLADRRKQAIDGVPTLELIGPIYPSFLSLVNPQRKQFSHPLSKVFTDMMSTFPDISTLPEQVAILYIMFLVMRWQIAPTQENCDRLPEWMTPRPPQLFVPHPAWIDYLPWPRMRDRMVRVYPSVPFDEFFVPYTTTVSLNWPYDPQAVLVTAPGTDELSINPNFENHLRDLNNWSLGPAFAKAHPVLADTTKIKVEVDLRKGS